MDIVFTDPANILLFRYVCKITGIYAVGFVHLHKVSVEFFDLLGDGHPSGTGYLEKTVRCKVILQLFEIIFVASFFQEYIQE